ncbi:putative ABC transport system permease protein [Breznakia sp. PF5-3]|uniref:ABC transporter permease n=1 Tax=unclassified Breznakia TaxID=2623764 RepID=UPI002405CF01|nr:MULTISPECIES: ABC transporter permease [unclassified Breznakia]MDF9824037.1 putative ABC transport system permease protein [Breznakia sp. PM6-1]MDF9834897.1 putative ABC transport system permease protein [Breznakia sp. PF5-3]MDF9837081.1 putative ABC transport system permease protein [Breznakia sp. PFB2-8]MDF9859006.1 putative ABC transport system permease protein [Breznakia sp. PH5-24]
MKNALRKDTLREIKHSYKRFVSILLMAMLGVAVFVGISASGVNMRSSLKDYQNDHNVYDIKISSTLGFQKDDVKAIRDLDDVENAYGIYEQDHIVEYEKTQYVFHIMEYETNINRPSIVKGKQPSTKTECSIDEQFAKAQGIQIGDFLDIQDSDDIFQKNNVKVVGFVKSPLYISDEKDASNLGSGKVESYMYINQNNLKASGIRTIYVLAENAKRMNSESDEYERLIQNIEDNIKDISDKQKELRYEQIVEDELKPYEVNGVLMLSDEQQQEIRDAVPYPTWYIQDRETANIGYSAWIQESNNIDNISRIFPIIFYAVATLMSLTAMTRMVDEERTQIGTLKGLGYSKSKIASKYISYAMLATLIGTILGVIIGFYFLTNIVVSLCSTGYSLPKHAILFDYKIAFIGIAIAIICIVGGAVYASYEKLRLVPATLMRPEAPKQGKRVLLERVTFLWKRLSFTQKVTLRNIFRYKKRFLMTIFGICGATSLVLIGFGVDNSISQMTPLQYEEIYQYQVMVGTNSDESSFYNEIKDNQEVKELLPIYMQSVDIEYGKDNKSISMMVIEDTKAFNSFIKLRDPKNSKGYTLKDNEVILTQPIANALSIKTGDTITIKDEDKGEKEVTVGAICEQYMSNNIYMSKALYEHIFNESPTSNMLLLKTDMLNEKAENNFVESLLETDHVTSVHLLSDMQGSIMSFDYVIIIIIIASGLLTFLVLYNLSNVNINERIRELATLKVLGFYNNEVDQYVNREMIILSLIGIFFGMFGGTLLVNLVFSAAETDYTIFPKIIEPISYVYAALIVFGFTIIVCIFSHYSLKKINMIESLKSVE